MTSERLTEAQVRELAHGGKARHAGQCECVAPKPGTRGLWKDDYERVGFSDDIIKALATEVLAARARMAELEAALDTERYRHGHLSRCKSRYSDRWSDSPDCDCGYDRRDAAYFTGLAAEATASADWTAKAPSGEATR